MTMRVLLFIGTGWAFGSVHAELVKFMHSRGVVADMLDWSKGYSQAEMSMMAEYYDFFYGVPGETWPLTDSYGIPPERILERSQPGLVASGGEIEEVTSVLGGRGQRCPRFAFRLVAVCKAAEPAEIRPSAQGLRYDDDLLSVDLERGAKERSHPERVAGLHETDGSVDPTRVSECERGHLEVSGAPG